MFSCKARVLVIFLEQNLVYIVMLLVKEGNQFVNCKRKLCLQVNPDMVDVLEAAGLRFVGKDETGRRMEVMSHTVVR